MGGSLRMLHNLAKYLSVKHDVVFAAPEFESQLAPLFRHVKNPLAIESKGLDLQRHNFDAALYHLPHGNDALVDAKIPMKSLVVLELMNRYPLKLDSDNFDKFSRVIYLHDDQLQYLAQHGCRERTLQLAIVNDVDFELPFRRTGKVASIGVANFKHDLRLAIRMLRNTPNCKQLNIYSPSRKLDYDNLAFPEQCKYLYYSVVNKLKIRRVETDLRKLYRGFDCLFHIPKDGNGTSMVVSNALACGKPVVLSSLESYRKAYGNLTGVYFVDDIDYDLTAILKDLNPQVAARIKNDYREWYDRDRVLRQWQDTILGS